MELNCGLMKTLVWLLHVEIGFERCTRSLVTTTATATQVKVAGTWFTSVSHVRFGNVKVELVCLVSTLVALPVLKFYLRHRRKDACGSFLRKPPIKNNL